MLSVFGWWGESRRWAGGEVGMDGLLFLACLAICPGVKMCAQRGCPWARGGQPDWQQAEANESEFLLGVAAILFLGGLLPLLYLPPPPHVSTHCLICHCQVCLRGAAGVKLAL